MRYYINDRAAWESRGPFHSYTRAVNAALAQLQRESDGTLLAALRARKSIHQVLEANLLHVSTRREFSPQGDAL